MIGRVEKASWHLSIKTQKGENTHLKRGEITNIQEVWTLATHVLSPCEASFSINLFLHTLLSKTNSLLPKEHQMVFFWLSSQGFCCVAVVTFLLSEAQPPIFSGNLLAIGLELCDLTRFLGSWNEFFTQRPPWFWASSSLAVVSSIHKLPIHT